LLEQVKSAMDHQSAAAREYPLFDWLRFVLASAVALSHSGVIAWEQGGNLAVQVFFALSGWLIGGILLRTDRKDLPRFFFNRATRVWIPYAFTVTALYSLSLFRDPLNARWFEFLLYDVTFTHNWFSLRPDAASALAQMPLKGTGNHFWSIAIEEQFYLAAPLLILFSRLGRRPVTWLSISACLLAFSPSFSSISMGVFAAALQYKSGDWYLRPLVVSATVGALVASAAAMTMPDAYRFVAPVFAISVVLLAARQGARGPIGKFAGGVSFPLYLNAWMGGFAVNALLKRVDIGSIEIAQVALYLGALASGTFTYLFIDRIVLARRNAYYSAKIGRRMAVAAYSLVGFGLVFGIYRWGW
jgi:peptidoglycan/LPS O-acetylase OafA/YrhL